MTLATRKRTRTRTKASCTAFHNLTTAPRHVFNVRVPSAPCCDPTPRYACTYPRRTRNAAFQVPPRHAQRRTGVRHTGRRPAFQVSRGQPHREAQGQGEHVQLGAAANQGGRRHVLLRFRDHDYAGSACPPVVSIVLAAARTRG